MDNQGQGLYFRLFGDHQTLVFHKPVFLAFGKDIEMTMIFESIVFWADKGIRKDGWFWHSRADWENELGVSPYQQRKIEAQLVRMGFIQTKVMRANGAPTTHYKLNTETVISWLVNVVGRVKAAPDAAPNMENSTLDNEKFDNPLSKISQSLTVNLNTVNLLKDSGKNNSEQKSAKRGRPPKEKPTEKEPLHESLIVYRSEARRHVPIAWRAEVIDTVGERVDEWRALVHEWVGRGYNPGNVADMLKAFRAGGLKPLHGQKRQQPPPHQNTDEEDAMFELTYNFARKTPLGFRIGSQAWYDKFGCGSRAILEQMIVLWKHTGVDHVPNA